MRHQIPSASLSPMLLVGLLPRQRQTRLAIRDHLGKASKGQTTKYTNTCTNIQSKSNKWHCKHTCTIKKESHVPPYSFHTTVHRPTTPHNQHREQGVTYMCIGPRESHCIHSCDRQQCSALENIQ